MAKTRRILCMLLALALMLTNVPAVFAAESATAVKPLRTETVYNPLYEGLVTKEKTTYSQKYFTSPAETDAQVEAKCTQDYNAIVTTLREGMENRQGTVVLYFATDKVLNKDWIKALFEDALAETDKPTQGDSLRWAWDKYSGNTANAFESKTLKLNCYKFVFSINYYTTKAQEEELTKKVNQVLDSFGFTEKTTSTQKLMAIYDYITENVRYDYDNLYNDSYTLKFTAYAAMVKNTAVCQGYATLFYRMAEMSGVDTRVIVGKGGGGDHAWNISKLGDFYYYLDPTWDEGLASYQYFLRGKTDFPDHESDTRYTTPEFLEKYPIAETYYDKAPELDPDKKYRLFTEENITLESDFFDYTGSEIRPAVQVVYDGATLKENIDYTLSFSDNISPGTATVTVLGLDLYTGSAATLTFRILPAEDERVFTREDISLAYTETEYTGNEIRPDVAVVYKPDGASKGIALKENTDYTLSYQNNTAIGTASVTVSGLGHYKSCVVQMPFRILPKKEAAVGNLSAILTAHNKINLSWTATSWANTDAESQGYAIYYKKATEKTYHYLITSFDKTFCNIKNLVSNTTYDFMVVKELTYGGETYTNGETASVQVTTLAMLTNAEPVTVALEGTTSIRISWKSVPTAHGYLIMGREGGDAGKWREWDRVYGETTTQYLAKDLNTNALHSFTVIPFHFLDNKTYVIRSAPYYSATTLDDLLPPESVAANLTSYNAATVSWNSVKGASHYRVYYRNINKSEFKLLTTTTALSYQKTSLTSSATYEFKIVPCIKVNDAYYEDASYKTAKITSGRNLAAPTTATAKLTSYNAATIGWSKVSYATHYKVYYKKASASAYTLLTTTTALSYKKTGLASATAYTFKIVPCMKVNDTVLADSSYKTVNITSGRNLAAPKTVTAKLTAYNAAKVSWSKVSYATHYKVYYKKASASAYTLLTTTTAVSYAKTNLSSASKYVFKIVPCIKVNGVIMADSSYTTVNISTTKNLSAPKTVTAKLYGHDDVKVSWSKVSGAKKYKVYYRKSTESSYTLKATTTNTYYNFANLADGAKYYFKIVPCSYVNEAYFADDSYKTATKTTLKQVATPTVSKVNNGKVSVKWTNIPGESGYQISKSTSKAKTSVAATFATTTGKSKTISATKGKTYYYKIRAYSVVDGKKIYGPWSNVKAYKLK